MSEATEKLADLSDAERVSLEVWLVEFDTGWTVDRLEVGLARLPAAAGAAWRQAAVEEMVKIDLERQWLQGQRPRLEDYLSRIPALGTCDTISPEMLVAEFLARQRVETVNATEYGSRFPNRAEEFERLLAAEAHSAFGASSGAETNAAMALAQSTPSLSSSVPCGPALPEHFGRYRIVRKLGGGGMGTVYLVHDMQLDRHVALKVPHFSATDGPEIIARFYREARAAGALYHPNICPVYDVASEEGIHYLTMAHIEGRPLSELVVPGQPLAEREAARIVATLATALQVAHARGIIHRDLKPSNVMINAAGEPVILDFGLARRLDGVDSQLTHSNSLIGTPAYMSPEQVRGKSTGSGPACDVYALGVMLYELLAGRRPFTGSLTTVLAKILTEQPEPLASVRPGIDPRLAAIGHRAMAGCPAERYALMSDLAGDLAAYLKDEAPPTAQVQAGGRRRRPSWLVVAASAGFLVFVLAAIFYITTNTGTVRIAVDDPQAKIKVDGDEITIGDTREPLRLRVGTHALEIAHGGTVIATREFTIRRGANPAIEIRLEATTAKAPGGATPGMLTRGSPPPAVAPFDAGHARTYQQAWAKYLGTAAEMSNPVGAKMILIPPGEFTMGATQAEIDRELEKADSDAEKNYISILKSQLPQHQVTLTRPFWLAATEVTVGEFRKFVVATKYATDAERDGKGGSYHPGHVSTQSPEINWSRPGHEQTDECPVVQVSWNDAAAFCNWLSRQAKLPSVYIDGGSRKWRIAEGPGYRLPTEAQWEYACRAGTTTVHFWGDDPEEARFYCWFDGNSSRTTQPVGAKLANAFGLFDIQGNVMEWVQDCGNLYHFSHLPTIDPAGPPAAGGSRMARGGCWAHHTENCRSAHRVRGNAAQRNAFFGFRVARAIE